jgi:GTP cyclohydrolase II
LFYTGEGAQFGPETIAMQNGALSLESVVFGDKDHVDADRACAEFRSGRPVLIAHGGEALFTFPVEGLTADRFTAFTKLSAPIFPRLAVTARRARALGLDAAEPVALTLTRDADANTILSLVADANIDRVVEAAPAGVAASAGIELAKITLGLPAVLTAPAPATRSDVQVVTVDAKAVARFRRSAIRSLKISAEADIPLHGGLNARFVVFSEAIGGGSVAIIVGKPDLTRPVPVRLHSACLTGDVFGSRRCDCGDQLRLSLALLDQAGGGLVLYLAQEGRGLGLANKIRAYKLQNAGLDTVDANTTLGFDDDERDYAVAARMLEMLACTRVLLLTNNPTKLESLAGNGIEICGRLPLVTPVHADNRRYLTAKATRAGHRLDHLMDVLSEADR